MNKKTWISSVEGETETRSKKFFNNYYLCNKYNNKSEVKTKNILKIIFN